MQTSIQLIDLQFLGIPHAIAAYLIQTATGPLLIETGPHSTLEVLAEGLRRAGVEPKEVKHVLLTHIHLDHAGAAWQFAQWGAKVYVHPFGAAHLAEPGKLMESAKRIYQDDMDRLWGQMHPIPAEQVLPVADWQVLDFGDVKITAHHTPGHAVHHIAWQLGNALFTGDVAGVKIANGPVVPPCPPPDIHLADWRASIARMRQIAPQVLYLTHYGAIVDPMSHLSELETRLHAYADWMKGPFERGEAAEAVTPRFVEFVHADLRAHGVPNADLPVYDAANPPWMSVAGLLRFWRKQNPA